jgi:hypothetical protein
MDQRDDMVRLTEAMIGLEQAVSGMAGILEQHGRMLQRLLDASMAAPAEETQLHELILTLIARLDVQAGVLGRMEAGLGKVGIAVEGAARRTSA